MSLKERGSKVTKVRYKGNTVCTTNLAGMSDSLESKTVLVLWVSTGHTPSSAGWGSH